jgi:hypothetical protein
MKRPSWVLALPVLLCSCVRAHDGFGIEVSNRCEASVEFILDGGTVSSARSSLPWIGLGVGETRVYSVYTGDSGAYIWLRSPAREPVSIPAPRDDRDAQVVLRGSLCTADVLSP